MLPDDILLDIFHSCRLNEINETYYHQWESWGRLVHVCRRWRQIIFASPRHLHLRLCCTPGTPVRKQLSYWPALPIVIDYYGLEILGPNDEDDLIAALEHSDRVCVVRLGLMPTQLVKLFAVMQESFPVLKSLILTSDLDTPVLPSGFLGGSAPRLQVIQLRRIPFPGLPMFLLSARDLVTLGLSGIPPSGYISPEAMATGLAALTKLRYLDIGFELIKPCPDRIRLPPVTRIVLPALESFRFRGVGDCYLEDLVARIDSPRLNLIEIRYKNQRADLRVAQLFEFINCSEDLRLGHFGWLDVRFNPCGDIDLAICHARYNITICLSFPGREWGVSHIVQLFGQFSPKLSDVRHLSFAYSRGNSEIDNEWVQLLHPFTAVQTLFAYRNWVDPAVGDVTEEMVSEVLPALGLLYLYDTSPKFFKKFLEVRRLSDHPVTVPETELVPDRAG